MNYNNSKETAGQETVCGLTTWTMKLVNSGVHSTHSKSSSSLTRYSTTGLTWMNHQCLTTTRWHSPKQTYTLVNIVNKSSIRMFTMLMDFLWLKQHTKVLLKESTIKTKDLSCWVDQCSLVVRSMVQNGLVITNLNKNSLLFLLRCVFHFLYQVFHSVVLILADLLVNKARKYMQDGSKMPFSNHFTEHIHTLKQQIESLGSRVNSLQL